MSNDQKSIVILDGKTLNPGDLSWEPLHALGNCIAYDRTPPEQTLKRIGQAEIVLTNKTPLPREVISALPKTTYVGVLATGFNIVDIAAARDHGMTVTNVPAYGTNSVAQMVFAHLLEFTQRVAHHSQQVRNGRWAEADDFCFWDHLLVELDGLTMGIVGMGPIGRATARIAQAFGMHVLANDVAPVQPPPGVRMVELNELFCESDVVSLHCPLTPDNERLVSGDLLAMMKPTAYLINTSRGPLVDEDALAAALAEGRLAGAGLDVLAVEPPPTDHPLVAAANCHVTPHIAWATRAARSRLLNTAVDNVAAFLAGNPQNVVNG